MSVHNLTSSYRGWGHNAFWVDDAKTKVHGVLTPLPKNGDQILVDMKGGRQGLFVLSDVERGHTRDFFSALATWDGYNEVLPGF